MTQAIIADEIKKLIELQDIDSEIFRLSGELEEMPIKIKEFDGFIKEKEGIYKTSEDKLKKLEVGRKQKELDMQVKEEAVKKHQSKLYQVKTNDEYTAIEKEIGSLKADISVLEEEIINMLDDVEATRKELSKNKTVYEREKSIIETEKKKMEQQKTVLEADLKKIEDQRKEFSKNIDKNILTKYEKILLAKGGLALVPIIDDACSGCNMSLPPQVINEVKMKNDIIFCGQCTRILYSKE